MFETKLIYNDIEKKYHIYHHEEPIATEDDIKDALIWFMSCLTHDVQGVCVDNNTLLQYYGKRKKIKTMGGEGK